MSRKFLSLFAAAMLLLGVASPLFAAPKEAPQSSARPENRPEPHATPESCPNSADDAPPPPAREEAREEQKPARPAKQRPWPPSSDLIA